MMMMMPLGYGALSYGVTVCLTSTAVCQQGAISDNYYSTFSCTAGHGVTLALISWFEVDCLPSITYQMTYLVDEAPSILAL